MATLLLVVVKVSAKRFDTTELESNANLQPRNDDGNTTPPPPPPPPSQKDDYSCFAESTEVWTKTETQTDEDAKLISIGTLKEGDLVGTSNLNRKSSRPNDFKWTRATSVDISKDGNWTAHSFVFTKDLHLTVTSPHIMIIWKDNESYMVRADKVQVGDKMVVNENVREVQSIQTYMITTKVNVETEDGTINANGVLVSGFCDINPELLISTAPATTTIEGYTSSHFNETYNTACMDVNNYGYWYDTWMIKYGYNLMSY